VSGRPRCRKRLQSHPCILAVLSKSHTLANTQPQDSPAVSLSLLVSEASEAVTATPRLWRFTNLDISCGIIVIHLMVMSKVKSNYISLYVRAFYGCEYSWTSLCFSRKCYC